MKSKAHIAGILSIISGAWGILASISTIVIATVFVSDIASPEIVPFMINFYFSGLMTAITSILAIIGGVFALKRKKWGLALTGAIAAVLVFFPCGIPAIVLVSRAKQEFSSQETSTL